MTTRVLEKRLLIRNFYIPGKLRLCVAEERKRPNGERDFKMYIVQQL
jgi:hypothetical protein